MGPRARPNGRSVLRLKQGMGCATPAGILNRRLREAWSVACRWWQSCQVFPSRLPDPRKPPVIVKMNDIRNPATAQKAGNALQADRTGRG